MLMVFHIYDVSLFATQAEHKYGTQHTVTDRQTVRQMQQNQVWA